jgi:hypothetical protein
VTTSQELPRASSQSIVRKPRSLCSDSSTGPGNREREGDRELRLTKQKILALASCHHPAAVSTVSHPRPSTSSDRPNQREQHHEQPQQPGAIAAALLGVPMPVLPSPSAPRANAASVAAAGPLPTGRPLLLHRGRARPHGSHEGQAVRLIQGLIVSKDNDDDNNAVVVVIHRVVVWGKQVIIIFNDTQGAFSSP